MSLALIVVSIIVLVYWVAEPLALLNFELFGRWRPAVAIVEAPALSIPLAAGAVFIAFGLRSLCVDHISKIETAIFLSGVSVIVADAIKGQLKFVFGRAWPVSWKAGTISLITNGEHGFHFFRSGLESFPSGHAAAVAAIVTVLWIFYPTTRVLGTMCLLAVSFALVMLDYHFLSDVIAGAFLGISVSIFFVALWRAAAR